VATLFLQNFFKMTAFIIGNGNSRLSFDLTELSKHGKMYGCNALYRDHIPDVLVSVDPPITEEISKYNIPLQTKHYARKPKHDASHKLTEKQNSGYSSGPIACKLASLDAHSTQFLVGFDFASLNDNINNVYAGTNGYWPKTNRATYHGNWVKQFAEIFEEFPEYKYYRVLDNIITYVPEEWNQVDNVENINFETFNMMLNSI
tara:strand:- start:4828 stop:5436 length:609 start_codon:yes stop_codon:yes gene_type:complete